MRTVAPAVPDLHPPWPCLSRATLWQPPVTALVEEEALDQERALAYGCLPAHNRETVDQETN